MALLRANNAVTTLVAQLSAAALTLTLPAADRALFPALAAAVAPAVISADWFIATLDDGAGNYEIVRVTLYDAVTGAATIIRAQEGTVAALWGAGTTLSIRFTAGMATQIDTDISLRAGTEVESGVAAGSYVAASTVFMTADTDITVAGTADIAIPAGSAFMVREIGVVFSRHTALSTATAQPTVEFSTSLDGTAYTSAATGEATVSLTESNTFQSIMTGGFSTVAHHLRATILTPALYEDGAAVAQPAKARFYFKGILVRE